MTACIQDADLLEAELDDPLRVGFGRPIHVRLDASRHGVAYRRVLQLEALLRRLGSTLEPLALVSVGFQLRLSQIRGRMRLLALGLGFKLVLGPLLVLAVLAGLLGQRGPVIAVTVFEAAMGPMIGAAIVAMDHDLDPSLVTLMVGLGIPLSFAVLPAWWWLLQAVA